MAERFICRRTRRSRVPKDQPSDEVLRERWRLNWLQCIQEISDLKQQKAMWLDPKNTNPHWSFSEYMCSYFDDCWLNDDDGGYDRKVEDGWVNNEEIAAVAPFHNLFKVYQPPNNAHHDDKAILNDPAWLKIVSLALDAQQLLKNLVSNDQELHSLIQWADKNERYSWKKRDA